MARKRTKITFPVVNLDNLNYKLAVPFTSVEIDIFSNMALENDFVSYKVVPGLDGSGFYHLLAFYSSSSTPVFLLAGSYERLTALSSYLIRNFAHGY